MVLDRGQQQKRPGSGEDAFFASRVGADTNTGGAIAFGVADGVGGWAEHRVDPAEVSHGLCTYMAEYALAVADRQQQALLKPKELLQKGYNAVLADKSIVAGGTTASVGVAQPDGRVELAKYIHIHFPFFLKKKNYLLIKSQFMLMREKQSRRLRLRPAQTSRGTPILDPPDTRLQHALPAQRDPAAHAPASAHVWRHVL